MKHLLTFAVAAAIATGACAQGVEQGAKNAPQFTPAFPNQTRAPAMDRGVAMQIDVLAEGLETPWGVEVLPEGGYLVTERSGALRMLKDGKVSAPISGVPQVLAERQGGLLDVALAEDFVGDGCVACCAECRWQGAYRFARRLCARPAIAQCHALRLPRRAAGRYPLYHYRRAFLDP